MENIYCLSNYQCHPAGWRSWSLGSHKKMGGATARPNCWDLVSHRKTLRIAFSQSHWFFTRPPSPSETKRLRPL